MTVTWRVPAAEPWWKVLLLPGTEEQRPLGWAATKLRIATVTKEQADPCSIQDLCFIGLDLLAKWGAAVDVSGAKLFLGR